MYKASKIEKKIDSKYEFGKWEFRWFMLDKFIKRQVTFLSRYRNENSLSLGDEHCWPRSVQCVIHLMA